MSKGSECAESKQQADIGGLPSKFDKRYAYSRFQKSIFNMLLTNTSI